MTTQTTSPLPRPSRVHATCAWCRAEFATIVDLIDHVDRGHTPILSAPTPNPSRALAERTV